MLISPDKFLAEYENASYSELLKLKNEFVQAISDFENAYEKGKIDKNICPSPDVKYQWNLTVLSKLVSIVQVAFNKEFEKNKKK